MSRYRLAEPARHDIATILADSAKHFGEVASERYELLIATALVDLASNPERPGSRATPELGAGSRLYHLRNSRGRAGSSGSKVSNPRHFILYKVIGSGVVGIARLLHDSMDLSCHITDDFGRVALSLTPVVHGTDRLLPKTDVQLCAQSRLFGNGVATSGSGRTLMCGSRPGWTAEMGT